jgi:transcriptional regulator with XRE-family HTH domain
MKIAINHVFLKEHMRKHNIKSYRQMAELIGISSSTLSRAMRRERNPGQLVIRKMLLYFKQYKEPFERIFVFIDD